MNKDTKTLGIMKTHLLNNHILTEYIKFSSSNLLSDTILFIDNHNNLIPNYSNSKIVNFTYNKHNIQSFLFNQVLLKELELPSIVNNNYCDDIGQVMWYNSDYPLYIISRYFPNYNYYWFTEYDVYCNGNSYNPFFKEYEQNTSDLLITDFRSVDNPNEDWYWKYFAEWIYPDTEKYGCFFPIERLSKPAIDFLYKKRLEHWKIYKQHINSNIYRWLFCEFFTATELANNGFVCEKLNFNYVRWNYKFDKNEIVKNPNNKLYHPIR